MTGVQTCALPISIAEPDLENKEDEFINTQLKGSLDKILSYAECEGDLEASFRKNIGEYKRTINKNGTEDEARQLRHQITKEFYQVYTSAFMKSIHDKEIPKVVKMLFYFGYYGVNLHLITKFVKQYLKEGPIEKFDERRLQKMLLLCKNEFGDPGMDSLTMFCSPIEVIATKTDCVFNAIVIDKEDFCHANIESDEGRCSLKCMLYNDYDVCHCHRTEEAELRAGVLLLGNVNLNKYMTELKQRYHVINDQIRAITLPNCGNKNNWNSELMEFDVRKNAVFWICPLQSQTPDKVLREIKSKNARYRIIGLNENYGSCFNGFLTEKL